MKGQVSYFYQVFKFVISMISYRRSLQQMYLFWNTEWTGNSLIFSWSLIKNDSLRMLNPRLGGQQIDHQNDIYLKILDIVLAYNN